MPRDNVTWDRPEPARAAMPPPPPVQMAGASLQLRLPPVRASELGAYGSCSMVKVPSLAGQSSPSQPPHIKASGSRLLYTLWRSRGATPLARRG